MLIVFGLVLLVADRLPERRRQLSEFSLAHALMMGVGQALALQPGVSRSGATLTVARFIGFERDTAARLVFLMSLPIIAGAGRVRPARRQYPVVVLAAVPVGHGGVGGDRMARGVGHAAARA